MYLLIILFFIFLICFLLRWFIKGPMATRRNMKDKVVIITGSSSGIGKESAFSLLEDGATVIFACRNKSKTQDVINQTKTLKNGEECFKRSHFIKLDLTSFKSVDNFVKEFKAKFNRLDILMNNAGLINSKFDLTEDGLESMVQSNHYSHVRLTMALLDSFNQEEGRIINVSSMGHMLSNYSTHLKTNFSKSQGHDQFKSFFGSFINSFTTYGNTKLANVYFAQYLAELIEKTPKYKHIKAFSLHPGVISTNFADGFKGTLTGKITYIISYPITQLIYKTCIEGAQTQLHLCYESLDKLSNGSYYNDNKVAQISSTARNKELRNYLMEETLKETNKKIE